MKIIINDLEIEAENVKLSSRPVYDETGEKVLYIAHEITCQEKKE